LGPLQTAHELFDVYSVLAGFSAIDEDNRDLFAILAIERSMFGDVDLAQGKRVGGL
jgi:hypothetical protein